MSHNERSQTGFTEQSQQFIGLHDYDIIKSMDFYSLAEIVDTKRNKTGMEDNQKENAEDSDDDENKELIEQCSLIEESLNDLFFLKVKEIFVSDKGN